jgi:hypothetical protein
MFNHKGCRSEESSNLSSRFEQLLALDRIKIVGSRKVTLNAGHLCNYDEAVDSAS